MKSFFVALLSLALCTLGLARTAPHPHMEHNAFLVRPVFSVEQLVEQVRTEPEVLQRFQAHFRGASRQRLLDVFASLRLVPLKRTQRYLVFNVDPKTLQVGGKMLNYKAGTLVFADRKGKPILKRSCGNPMVKQLDRPTILSAVTELSPTTSSTVSAIDPEGASEYTPMAEEPLESAELVSPTPGPLEPAVPSLPTPDAVIPSNLVNNLTIGGGNNWLGGLLGGIGAIGGGLVDLGGGGIGNSPPPPVPEPASVAALALGAAGLASRRRRR